MVIALKLYSKISIVIKLSSNKIKISISNRILYSKLYSNNKTFVPQVLMLVEKEDRYTLLVLDRYRRKLQIIEPEETSLEELKRQEYLKINVIDMCKKAH